MNDPFLAPVDDLLPSAAFSDAITTTRLLAEGLSDALVSAHGKGQLSEAAWDPISRRPAEIMGLTDRGVLDHGKRADLAIMNAETHVIEATIAKGRLAYATGDAAQRFRRDAALWPMAAEWPRVSAFLINLSATSVPLTSFACLSHLIAQGSHGKAPVTCTHIGGGGRPAGQDRRQLQRSG